jgi:outer membrane receptor protein involved in Fe transport
VASPRGSAGSLPRDQRADANIVYTPSFAKGLKLKLDVLNVFNRQAIEVIEERYNTPGGASTVWNRYATVESYNAPRSMKLTVTYDQKF